MDSGNLKLQLVKGPRAYVRNLHKYATVRRTDESHSVCVCVCVCVCKFDHHYYGLSRKQQAVRLNDPNYAVRAHLQVEGGVDADGVRVRELFQE